VTPYDRAVPRSRKPIQQEALRRRELANEEAAATPAWLRKPSGLVCGECCRLDDDPAERRWTMHPDCDWALVRFRPRCQELEFGR
jgi:hypothetical protein